MKRTRRILLAASVLALVAACGSDDPVTVDGAWARATASAQTNGVVYFEITADHDDVLTRPVVDPSVAAEAQIHEVVPAEEMDDEAMDEMDHDDMDTDDMDTDADGDSAAPEMTMRQLSDGLPLPEDETVVFGPGGYHVMLVDLAEPLEVGDEFDLTLEFEDSDAMTIGIEVEETAP